MLPLRTDGGGESGEGGDFLASNSFWQLPAFLGLELHHCNPCLLVSVLAWFSSVSLYPDIPLLVRIPVTGTGSSNAVWSHLHLDLQRPYFQISSHSEGPGRCEFSEDIPIHEVFWTASQEWESEIYQTSTFQPLVKFSPGLPHPQIGDQTRFINF